MDCDSFNIDNYNNTISKIMKSIKDFIATKVSMTKTAFQKTYDWDDDYVNGYKVLVYADGMHIEVLDRGRFYLMIERSEIIHDSIHYLESMLWDWYKHEINLHFDDQKRDIDNRMDAEIIRLGFQGSHDNREDFINYVKDTYEGKLVNYLLGQELEMYKYNEK